MDLHLGRDPYSGQPCSPGRTGSSKALPIVAEKLVFEKRLACVIKAVYFPTDRRGRRQVNADLSGWHIVLCRDPSRHISLRSFLACQSSCSTKCHSRLDGDRTL